MLPKCKLEGSTLSHERYPSQWYPRGRWLRKMRHGVPPFPWMHCWGYPGPAAPCQNSEQAQADAAASSPPAAGGKRGWSAKGERWWRSQRSWDFTAQCGIWVGKDMGTNLICVKSLAPFRTLCLWRVWWPHNI